MKLSLNWLCSYVDISGLTAKDIANGLTMSGSKVESIEEQFSKIKNIVVGKVLSVKKHENAEKLVICNVLIGENKTVQIVTGAKNVVAGALVPVCLNGATLFDGTVIKNQKLRGVLSEGMMCSLSELGLSKAMFPYAVEDGIFLIEESCEVGQDIKQALKINDTVLDFEITSNRPDCLSVYGLAREVSATFSLPLKTPSFKKPSNFSQNSSNVKVSVKSPLCKRYMAKSVFNVKIAASPLWLRNRLSASGVKPINNVVDITNYVMLEYGIPMHAFDIDKVKNQEIVVRCANKGEKIKALDNNEYVLTEENLVVCDSEKPLSIAGVIGGLNCAIDENTKNVMFEVACFDGTSILKTSRNFSIKTESAIRFEKGLNLNCCSQSLKRACELTEMLNIGDIDSKTIDVKNCNEEELAIPLDVSFINNFLGVNISKDCMENILTSLWFKIEESYVKVPSFRIDVKNKADIAEEIARIYGYNNIPSILPSTVTKNLGYSKAQQFTNQIKNTALALGLYEIYNFSFISPKLYEKMNFDMQNVNENSIKISNPFGEDSELMRISLLPSVFNSLVKNFKNKNEEARLFELGKVYIKNGTDIEEKEKLCIGIYEKDYDFYSFKGLIEALLNNLKIYDVKFEATKQNSFHPFICCKILKDNEAIGIFGEVCSNVRENFKIKQKVYMAELSCEALLKFKKDNISYSPISKFPSIFRDICLVCKQDVSCATVENEIKNGIKDILEKIEVFDVYKGEQLKEDEKSISFKIFMRRQDRTLKDCEINVIIEKLLKNIEKKGIYLRNV